MYPASLMPAVFRWLVKYTVVLRLLYGKQYAMVLLFELSSAVESVRGSTNWIGYDKNTQNTQSPKLNLNQRAVVAYTCKNWSCLCAYDCDQANSASYPQWAGKWVVAYELRGEGLLGWLGRWYVCMLHVSPVVRYSAGNGWPHNALWYH